tara:strand:+ start:5286 stop:6071 length:786 start_codon:yes stop_codon:yes gene_type:complete
VIKTSVLLLLLFLSAFVLNHTIVKNNIIKIPNNIVGIVFVLISLPLIELDASLWTGISSLLLVLLYDQLLNFSHLVNIKNAIFKTGFILGLMTLAYSGFSYFYPIILVSLFYYSQFNWKHMAIQLMGLFYPLGFVYVISKIYTPLNLFSILPKYSQNFSSALHDYYLWGFIVLAIFILSIQELYKNYYRKTEKAKKGFNILFFFSAFIISYTLLFKSFLLTHLVSIPVSILVANYLIYIKNVKFRTFLLGLLCLSFIFKFF